MDKATTPAESCISHIRNNDLINAHKIIASLCEGNSDALIMALKDMDHADEKTAWCVVSAIDMILAQRRFGHRITERGIALCEETLRQIARCHDINTVINSRITGRLEKVCEIAVRTKTWNKNRGTLKAKDHLEAFPILRRIMGDALPAKITCNPHHPLARILARASCVRDPCGHERSTEPWVNYTKNQKFFCIPA